MIRVDGHPELLLRILHNRRTACIKKSELLHRSLDRFLLTCWGYLWGTRPARLIAHNALQVNELGEPIDYGISLIWPNKPHPPPR